MVKVGLVVGKSTLLLSVCLAMVGCPLFGGAPDVRVALIVEPLVLDFGLNTLSQQFTVRKSNSSRPLLPFTLTSDQPWLSVSPSTGDSDSIRDRFVTTVTVDRRFMNINQNEGVITVESDSAVPVKIYVRANATLEADFSVETVNGLLIEDLPVQFRDESKISPGFGRIEKWEWDFGDGESSTDPEPVHTYGLPGVYDVKLTVTTDRGLSSTRLKADFAHVVSEAPDADFDANDKTVTVGQQVQFFDVSTPGSEPIDSWLWEFGDGATSTEPNPVHAYAKVGKYAVQLKITTAVGQSREVKLRFITVSESEEGSLDADFSADKTSVFIGEAVEFTDESVSSIGPIVSWQWSFGDGGTSTDQNPTHIFTVARTYPITLTITAGTATDTEIKQRYITVKQSQKPTAKFEVDDTIVFTGQTVRFTDLSDPGTLPITQWLWDFGDGQTSSAQNAVHLYDLPGTYTVSLTVASNVGSDVEKKESLIFVEQGVAPTAQFTANNTSVFKGQTVQFTDQSIAGSLPITQWLWNFGDGSTSTAQNPSHAYSSAGVFSVSLTVTSGVGANTVTRTSFISVTLGLPPTAAFTVDKTTAFTNEFFQFTDSSTQGALPISDWLWNFGDGNTSTLQNPTHSYLTAGTFNVSLTVTTPVGTDIESKSSLITVTQSVPPTADFSADDTTPLTNTLVQFTDRSLAGTSPITQWSWSFGDGGTSTEQNPTHAYAQAGTYNVGLTVTSAHGSNTKTRNAYITVSALPTANFSVDDATPVTGQTVQFTNLSIPGSSPITTRLWNFGDNTPTSNAQNPSHAYATEGVYTVSLTVTTAVGSDIESKVGFISVAQGVLPNADFSATPTSILSGEFVQFTDLSTAGSLPITSRTWNFGDSTPTSNAISPTHVYSTAGTYTVSLTVITGVGSDTESKTDLITVNPRVPPTADFIADRRQVLTIEPVKFTDLSTVGTSPISSWSWSFGDNTTSTQQNPTHTYAATGVYDVSLTVSANSGQESDTETKTGFVQVFQTTELDKYVRKADSNFSATLQGEPQVGSGFVAYVLKLVSQAWRLYPSDISRIGNRESSVWQHTLTIVAPDLSKKAISNTALLLLSGGSVYSTLPDAGSLQKLGELAQDSQSVVAMLEQVPNQPIKFADENGFRIDNSLVAYTYSKYLGSTSLTDFPLMSPMVKSAVKAMDAVQGFMIGPQALDKALIDEFVVAGASKRGLATWLTGATDPKRRVVGIIPMAADLMNMSAQLEHMLAVYGAYPLPLADYVLPIGAASQGVFPRINTPQGISLRQIVDPYEYRARLSMPKYIISGTGDEFYTPDSAQFYFDDLIGASNRLVYRPNRGHALNAGNYINDLQEALPFFSDAASGAPLGDIAWTFDAENSVTVTTGDDTPVSVLLWEAVTSPDLRDFRTSTSPVPIWNLSVLPPNVGNEYIATVTTPEDGSYRGYFVQVNYANGSKYTTELRVTPGTRPFEGAKIETEEWADLNGSDSVDAYDIAIIAQAALGRKGYEGLDVDGNQEANAVDVQNIVNKALNRR